MWLFLTAEVWRVIKYLLPEVKALCLHDGK
jgi:hypothetical protein